MEIRMENSFMNKAIYDQFASTYDSSYNHPVFKAEDRIIDKMIIDGGHLSGRTLDIGCGTGYLLDHFDIQPDHYVGIDISEKMLNVARHKHPEHLLINHDMASLPNLVSHHGKFDNVIGLYSVSYASDIKKVVCGIKKALCHNGKFFLVLYGRKYRHRSLYIMNRSQLHPKIRCFRKETARKFLKPLSGDIKIRGVNVIADYLPRWLIKTYLPIESSITRKCFIKYCQYLVVSGIRD